MAEILKTAEVQASVSSNLTRSASDSGAEAGGRRGDRVYRNNYLAVVEAATHNASFASLIATLPFAQRYTARIDFSSRLSAEADLVRTNALRDPDEADDVGIRLRQPD